MLARMTGMQVGTIGCEATGEVEDDDRMRRALLWTICDAPQGPVAPRASTRRLPASGT